MRELEVAYPKLKRDWCAVGGVVVRLRPPGSKGIPDFVLLSRRGRPVFCEVKCVESEKDVIGLDFIQVDTLRMLYDYKGAAVVVALCLRSHAWGVYDVRNVSTTTRYVQYYKEAKDPMALQRAVYECQVG